MILLARKLNLFFVILSYITYFTSIKIVIRSCDKSLLVSWLKPKLLDNLEFQSFAILEFFDPDVCDGDSQKFINRTSGHYISIFKFSDKMTAYFTGVENFRDKYEIALHRFLSDKLSYEIQSIEWLERRGYSQKTILIFGELKPGAKFIWRMSNFNTLFFFNYTSFFANNCFKYINKVLVRSPQAIKKLVLSGFSKKINISISISQPKKKFDVIFFPHNSIFTNMGFIKDHYYSPDIDSAFHPKNILHLEYDKRTNITTSAKRAMELLNIDSINYLKVSGRISFKAILSVFYTLNTICFDKKSTHEDRLVSFFIFTVILLRYRYYKDFMVKYSNAKVALVGFDILFPVELSLALESHDIATLSLQDRVRPCLVNNYSYVFKYQMSISNFFDQRINEKNKNFVVESIFPIGQIRTDLFFNTNIPIPTTFKCRVAVLDYHIAFEDEEKQTFFPILNWDNDIYFRGVIIKLAKLYPDVEFVFAGKSSEWIEVAQLKPTVAEMLKLNNVNIYMQEDFSSYDIISSSDLVLARQTSLADECVSMYIDTIIVDFGINYTHQNEHFYPEALKPLFIQSVDQLLYEMDHFVSYGSTSFYEDIKSESNFIFSSLSDGKVRNRLHQFMRSVFELY